MQEVAGYVFSCFIMFFPILIWSGFFLLSNFYFFSRASDERSYQKLEKVGPFECDELEKHCRRVLLNEKSTKRLEMLLARKYFYRDSGKTDENVEKDKRSLLMIR